MKPEGMSDKAWVELHKVIARIEAKVNAKRSVDRMSEYHVKVVSVPTFPVQTKRVELEHEFFPNGMTADQVKLLAKVEQLLHEAHKAGFDAANIMGPDEAWSNNAAMGYAIQAAERDMKPEQIRSLVNGMRWRFDMSTVDEAKQHYEQSSY